MMNFDKFERFMDKIEEAGMTVGYYMNDNYKVKPIDYLDDEKVIAVKIYDLEDYINNSFNLDNLEGHWTSYEEEHNEELERYLDKLNKK